MCVNVIWCICMFTTVCLIIFIYCFLIKYCSWTIKSNINKRSSLCHCPKTVLVSDKKGVYLTLGQCAKFRYLYQQAVKAQTRLASAFSTRIHEMSRGMRFPTMWYVRPAKAQTSLRIRADWSEPLLVALIFYDCLATNRTSFGVSRLKRWLQKFVWVYTCQNATLLEITCHGSIMDEEEGPLDKSAWAFIWFFAYTKWMEDLRLSGSTIRKSRYIFTKERRIIRQKSGCLSHSYKRIIQVNIQMQGRIKDSWKGVSYAYKMLVLLCGFYHNLKYSMKMK